MQISGIYLAVYILPCFLCASFYVIHHISLHLSAVSFLEKRQCKTKHFVVVGTSLSQNQQTMDTRK